MKYQKKKEKLDYLLKSSVKVKGFEMYRMAMYKIKEKYKDINCNGLEMMIVMYRFEFLSGNTMRKVFPLSPRYYEVVCEKLIKGGYVREAFKNTIISVIIQKETHNVKEDRMLRRRFALSDKGRAVVEEFYSISSKFTIDNSADRICEGEFRDQKGSFKKTTHESYMSAKAGSLNGYIYFEEEGYMWGDE